jgi:hypothetical protein
VESLQSITLAKLHAQTIAGYFDFDVFAAG